ncbi:hypothetical protein BDN72DRAFT_898385 [Pluteus cervinus]|uniref:Uncharacterized protein n=1 Tax=Pluteus cervinus TaxID=181527 RepID=A0ACD3AR46_9AGAR|nr:hypothetical protein BDN72DRAFT_898385 [Pluteus cervinus]
MQLPRVGFAHNGAVDLLEGQEDITKKGRGLSTTTVTLPFSPNATSYKLLNTSSFKVAMNLRVQDSGGVGTQVYTALLPSVVTLIWFSPNDPAKRESPRFSRPIRSETSIALFLGSSSADLRLQSNPIEEHMLQKINGDGQMLRANIDKSTHRGLAEHEVIIQNSCHAETGFSGFQQGLPANGEDWF